MSKYRYIKEKLDEKQLSISWLAKETNVSKGYLSKLINNKVSNPGFEKLECIHKALGIDNIQEDYRYAFIVDINHVSVDRYIKVCEYAIKHSVDIYIVKQSIKMSKFSLRKLYDYLLLENVNFELINESDIVKQVSCDYYTEVFVFNNEYFLNDNYTNITFEKEDWISVDNIQRNSILIVSNDQRLLSIILTILKLKTNYVVDDLAIHFKLETKSTNYIKHSLNIVSHVQQSVFDNYRYVVGNEYIYLELFKDSSLSEKKGIVRNKKYIEMFDEIINIGFNLDKEYYKNLYSQNQKLLKGFKRTDIELKDESLLETTKKIIKLLEV